MESTRIYLKVPFIEKQQVKKLGAKYDSYRQSWYIPDYLNPEDFKDWLMGDETEVVNNLLEPPTYQQTPAAPRDTQSTTWIRLSELLQGVQNQVNKTFSGTIWVVAEVASIKHHASGHTYLSLIEYDRDGQQELAKSQAYIWKQRRDILVKFERKSHQKLTASMSVLVQVRVRFHVQYGFGLEIIDIDAEYSLGIFIQKVKQLRQTLIKQGIFDNNKQHQLSHEITRVAVICPAEAAAKADFLHLMKPLIEFGLVCIDFYQVLFQGDQTAIQISQALTAIEQSSKPYQLTCLIRGGGAVTDLQYLENLQLLSQACRFSMPIWVGIGHQIDETSLDKIAHQSFITPTALAMELQQRLLSPLRLATNHWRNSQQRLVNLLQHQRYVLDQTSLNGSLWLVRLISARKRVIDQYQQINRRLVVFHNQQKWILQDFRSIHQTTLRQIQAKRLQLLSSYYQIKQLVNLARSLIQRQQTFTLPAKKLLKASCQQRLNLINQEKYRHHQALLVKQRAKLQSDQRYELIFQAIKHRQWQLQQQLMQLKTMLIQHDPERILQQGYAIITNAQGPICNLQQLSCNQRIQIRMKDGTQTFQIEKIPLA